MDCKKACLFVLAFTLTYTFTICSANRDFGNWNNNNDTDGGDSTDGSWPYRHHKADQAPKKVNVGGKSGTWRFGFNYQEWLWRIPPLYVNDTLVFKYDLPNATYGHSVYLMPNYRSFTGCDFRKAKLVGNVTRGAGKGFEFKFKKWMPHYFACGEHNAIHCKSGMMKFAVMPMLHSAYE